jgi:ATP-binding cassette, subfamily B, bacterial
MGGVERHLPTRAHQRKERALAQQNANLKSEFTIANVYNYNRTSAIRWIVSHVLRYRWLVLLAFLMFLAAYSGFSYARVMIGEAAALITEGTEAPRRLLWITLTIAGLLLMDGLGSLVTAMLSETVGTRFEHDARQELYESLLGKSQTFHDQQRVGDIMARATDDVRQFNVLITPGLLFLGDMTLGFIVPVFLIGTVSLELLIAPILLIIGHVLLVRRYVAKLGPVVTEQREHYGTMSAGLEETISGIDIVKATAQEAFEQRKFRRNAGLFRDFFVKQGQVEAVYWPLLLYWVAFAGIFLHCVVMFQGGRLTVPDIVAVMGLMYVVRFPIFVSLFAFSLWELGVAAAERILRIINTETDLDENPDGYVGALEGRITFEDVSFGYDPDDPVLKGITFEVQPGATVAIVGQTGSGKSTLTKLVNRTYDVTAGRVLVDGRDVREWNLDSLRSQVGSIEQDVFLFSRTIAENIAFGTTSATQEQIEHAAREAQAHDFIMTFKDDYKTEIGERGVTLSGGQRQRLALARAFLSNPSVLILDDSTSAIDSATEDEIQKALRRAQAGRTMLLITHRLSQIRWADYIILLENGQIVAGGTHDMLLKDSMHYRRIFARVERAANQPISGN